jgi:hypothetical protein
MKTIKILLLIYFFVFVKYVYAQEKEAIALGDTLIKNGDVKGAIIEYQKAYQINPNNLETTYSLAAAFSVNMQTDSALKYLYFYIAQDTAVWPFINPDFLNSRENNAWEEFEKKLVEQLLIKFNNSYKDLDYAKKLWKMRALDQAYYKEVEITRKKFGNFSSIEMAFASIKEKINKQNVKDLEELVNKKGWPKISNVGENAASAAYLIIQHSTIELQKKYISEIKKLCEENEAKWSNYAYMYDRIQMNENKPQKYGSQLRYNEEKKSYELYKLEDESKVDEWRKEVGLGNLAGYLAQFGINYLPPKK